MWACDREIGKQGVDIPHSPHIDVAQVNTRSFSVTARHVLAETAHFGISRKPPRPPRPTTLEPRPSTLIFFF